MPILDGKALAKARTDKGLSQEELSHATKTISGAKNQPINVSTISRIERKGEPTRVRGRTVDILAQALGVPPAKLSPHQQAQDRDSIRLRINSAARNAMNLVAHRYRIPAVQIVEIAPLLFFIAAEQSIRDRLARIAKLREAETAVYDARIPHLSRKLAVNDDEVASEEKSIEKRDLFATEVRTEATEDWEEINPFARYLRDSLEGLPGAPKLVEWPQWGPKYEICKDEAAVLVGGDERATELILNGIAALHEMPKGSPEERAKWVHEQSKRYWAELGIDVAEIDLEDLLRPKSNPDQGAAS
jgi:transcriptional regulator with XRE-family HTH domain